MNVSLVPNKSDYVFNRLLSLAVTQNATGYANMQTYKCSHRYTIK